MGGDDSGVIGITLRELLTEMRDEIRALRSVVDAVARDQALSSAVRSSAAIAVAWRSAGCFASRVWTISVASGCSGSGGGVPTPIDDDATRSAMSHGEAPAGTSIPHARFGTGLQARFWLRSTRSAIVSSPGPAQSHRSPFTPPSTMLAPRDRVDPLGGAR